MTIRVLSFLALFFLLAVPAQAVTTYTYTYTGDHFGTFPDCCGVPPGPRVAGVYTTADRITGSFTVAEGFVPGVAASLGTVFLGRALDLYGSGQSDVFFDGVIDYAFTDGHQTLTRANSTPQRIALAIPYALSGLGPLPEGTTLAGGAWDIYLTTDTGLIWVANSMGVRADAAVLDAENWGRNGGAGIGVPPDGSQRGTWAVSVPEPMSLLLVGAGIAGLFGARRFYRS
jgi:PEP-CTERM motif-containing protein